MTATWVVAKCKVLNAKISQQVIFIHLLKLTGLSDLQCHVSGA